LLAVERSACSARRHLRWVHEVLVQHFNLCRAHAFHDELREVRVRPKPVRHFDEATTMYGTAPVAREAAVERAHHATADAVADVNDRRAHPFRDRGDWAPVEATTARRAEPAAPAERHRSVKAPIRSPTTTDPAPT